MAQNRIYILKFINIFLSLDLLAKYYFAPAGCISSFGAPLTKSSNGWQNSDTDHSKRSIRGAELAPRPLPRELSHRGRDRTSPRPLDRRGDGLEGVRSVHVGAPSLLLPQDKWHRLHLREGVHDPRLHRDRLEQDQASAANPRARVQFSLHGTCSLDRSTFTRKMCMLCNWILFVRKKYTVNFTLIGKY